MEAVLTNILNVVPGWLALVLMLEIGRAHV